MLQTSTIHLQPRTLLLLYITGVHNTCGFHKIFMTHNIIHSLQPRQQSKCYLYCLVPREDLARFSLASPRIHAAMITRALSMLASTAERKYHRRRYISGTHHVINPSRPSPRFSYSKRQKLGMEAWERGYSCCVLSQVM